METDNNKHTKPDLIDELCSFRLSYTFEGPDYDSGISLLDHLTPDEDEDISRGRDEISFLAEHIEETFILPLQKENEVLNEKNELLNNEVEIQRGSIRQWKEENQLLKKENAELKKNYGIVHELLPVMHADGGHYVEKHGLEKATEDAINIYYQLRSDKEELLQALKEADTLIRDGLPNRCLREYEIKFCDHRNGSGNKCLECYSFKELINKHTPKP
jgi:hypothetical protein